jgi:hypothetical protein
LIAVAIGFYIEIRAHKLLAVRAILVGCVIAELAYSMLELSLFNLLKRFAFGSGLVTGTWWAHGYIYPWTVIACLSAAGVRCRPAALRTSRALQIAGKRIRRYKVPLFSFGLRDCFRAEYHHIAGWILEILSQKRTTKPNVTILAARIVAYSEM